jgi:hypothetical protein
MKFDPTGRLLRVDIGTLTLNISTSPVLHGPNTLETSYIYRWGLSPDHVWITFNLNDTV